MLILAALGSVRIGDQELTDIREWVIPVLPVNGDDLQKIGVAQGPRLGTILAEIEDWWIKEGFQPDREACLEKARQGL